MTPNHIKILYVLNALFFCSLIGMFFYTFPRHQQSLQVGQYTNGAPVNASNAEAVASVTVGDNSDNTTAVKAGPITQVGGGSLTIKDTISRQTYVVSTNAGTKVELVGAQKDSVEYQKEMDAYYAQIKLLIQDPIKNKAALASLTIPTPVVLTPGTLADLAVGAFVDATAASAISGKSFTAIKIVVYPPAAK